jgi:hypothetical protein
MAYRIEENPAKNCGILLGLDANWCYQAVNEDGQPCARFGKPVPACRPGIWESAKAQADQWANAQNNKP